MGEYTYATCGSFMKRERRAREHIETESYVGLVVRIEESDDILVSGLVETIQVRLI